VLPRAQRPLMSSTSWTQVVVAVTPTAPVDLAGRMVAPVAVLVVKAACLVSVVGPAGSSPVRAACRVGVLRAWAAATADPPFSNWLMRPG
jgi:hypothetical protein